ncbi:MAG: hypothetical protein ACOYW3_15995 [Bacteroidota bacterium]
MQRLIFESNPLWLAACLGVGLLYAWLLYSQTATWGKQANRWLFAGRTFVVAAICFLLIGPILKLTENDSEKPTFVMLVDNSLSVREAVDSTTREKILASLKSENEAIENGDYAVEMRGLDGATDIRFDQPTSDLHQSIRKVVSDFEGKNLAGIVLVSDGVYNSGTSPLYSALRIPVYTVGIGDTTERVDLALKNIAFNKIAYQGNQFPIHADVLVKGTTNETVKLALYQGGKLISQQEKNSGSRPLVSFDFLADANATGIQRFDLSVTALATEANTKNNRASIFVEVVEGKKKILIVSPSPHPDIKAFRAAIERNSNYEVAVHLPGIKEAAADWLSPDKTDLAIFLGALDNQGKTQSLLQRFSKSKTGLFLQLNSSSNLRQLEANGFAFTFENVSQKDEVTPLLNATFRDFVFSDNLAGTLAGYPPVTVPFGKFTFPSEATVLLYQKIGSVATARPLLLSWQDADHKTAVLLGEGIWRWRLNEFSETESTNHFDEVFSKLVQYLSTKEDKRKFRSFPIQNEFSDSEPVIFESQVYNDLFEPVYGYTIQIEVRGEDGKTVPYSYTTSPSGTRFRVGALREGVYRYRAYTTLNGKVEEVRGEFLVIAQNLEAQNLTADFDLLRKLADNTGGKFYTQENVSQLHTDVTKLEAKSIIHSEESFHPVINLKAVFFLLLLLISTEWLIRKYLGSY